MTELKTARSDRSGRSSAAPVSSMCAILSRLSDLTVKIGSMRFANPPASVTHSPIVPDPASAEVFLSVWGN